MAPELTSRFLGGVNLRFCGPQSFSCLLSTLSLCASNEQKQVSEWTHNQRLSSRPQPQRFFAPSGASFTPRPKSDTFQSSAAVICRVVFFCSPRTRPHTFFAIGSRTVAPCAPTPLRLRKQPAGSSLENQSVIRLAENISFS